MKHHALFFRKSGKISQNLSSAAVVIGALRVKSDVQAGLGLYCSSATLSDFLMLRPTLHVNMCYGRFT